MNNLNLPDPKLMDVAVPKNLKLGINLNKQKINNGLEVDKFKDEIKKNNAILIDLREESEIKKEGKILNSITVPFPKIENFLKENKKKFKDKELLFVDISGEDKLISDNFFTEVP